MTIIKSVRVPLLQDHLRATAQDVSEETTVISYGCSEVMIEIPIDAFEEIGVSRDNDVTLASNRHGKHHAHTNQKLFHVQSSTTRLPWNRIYRDFSWHVDDIQFPLSWP